MTYKSKCDKAEANNQKFSVDVYKLLQVITCLWMVEYNLKRALVVQQQLQFLAPVDLVSKVSELSLKLEQVLAAQRSQAYA